MKTCQLVSEMNVFRKCEMDDDCGSVVVDLLFGVLPVGCGGLCSSLFCCALLSSFAVILKRKRELVVLLLLSYGCLVTVNVLCLFVRVWMVGVCYLLFIKNLDQ